MCLEVRWESIRNQEWLSDFQLKQMCKWEYLLWKGRTLDHMNIVRDSGGGISNFFWIFGTSKWRHLISRWYIGREFCTRDENMGVICFTGKIIYWNGTEAWWGNGVGEMSFSTLTRVPRIKSKCFQNLKKLEKEELLKETKK